MSTVILHFFLGTIGSLAMFLRFAYLSGETQFSTPFGVILVGLSCAALSWYVSPWATPVTLLLYALASWVELKRDRAFERQRHRQR